ncbi:DOMON-like domain-containing protein [Fortiea contorta]|uniref:DOMON-like domain-containing protein n=1 Tax=Fortiea contorta TaxID=1892405 RepID=UPI000349AC99|nr:DOMON-like domain-containing protein [Fortiea contorta]
MNSQPFFLKPFFASESLPTVNITGNIARTDNHLAIEYTISGDLKEIIIASPTDTPTRKHELWENTCFEFFLGVKNSTQYWEFNFSPSGDWNVYRFDDYRQGMREETAWTQLPFSVQNLADSLAIALQINLNQILSPTQAIEVAITTVIQHKDSKITYFALTHQGAEPDFHRRDSFTIEL